VGDSAARPLSLEEAKVQLRAVWAAHSPSAWIRRHPLETVLTALIAGLVVGAMSGKRRAPAGESRFARLSRFLPRGLGKQLSSLLLQSLISGGSAAAASPPEPQTAPTA
jgi:hypothetical protein